MRLTVTAFLCGISPLTAYALPGWSHIYAFAEDMTMDEVFDVGHDTRNPECFDVHIPEGHQLAWTFTQQSAVIGNPAEGPYCLSAFEGPGCLERYLRGQQVYKNVETNNHMSYEFNTTMNIGDASFQWLLGECKGKTVGFTMTDAGPVPADPAVWEKNAFDEAYYVE